MDDGFFNLKDAKIAIVGLGLMGGSLALALRGKCAALYGIARDPATRALALRQNIVDQADEDPTKLLPLADVVILATPVPVILDTLEQLPHLTPNPCIVMDLGSTKRAIVEKMAALPERFDPIGGHPICGKEKLGLEQAERTLYYSAPFLLTPLPRTTARARAFAEQLIDALGSKGSVLDAIEHDHILAHTSHLPFLMSALLALVTPPEVAPYIGPGFRSTSRLAGTPSSMMLGILQTNRENLLPALEAVQDEIALLMDCLANDDADTLRTTLDAARAKYQDIIR